MDQPSPYPAPPHSDYVGQNLFQEVLLRQSTGDTSIRSDLNFEELSKATAVVISDRLGIAEGFQDGTGFQELVLDQASCRRDGRQEAEYEFGGFRFARSRFSTRSRFEIVTLLTKGYE